MRESLASPINFLLTIRDLVRRFNRYIFLIKTYHVFLRNYFDNIAPRT